MEILYCKASNYRKRMFQIKTFIVHESNRMLVIKRPIYKEGMQHIHQTYLNEKVLEPVYGTALVESEFDGKQIVTPFVKGESLGGRIRSTLINGGNIEKLMVQWKEMIAGNKKNICRFTVTDEFRQIFGDGTELEGDEATCVSNFDCTAENIIFISKDKFKVIDYEWVYSFPMPLDLIFYHALKVFHETNQELISWKELLRLSGININKMETYEKNIQKFYDFVCFDNVNQINYATFGKKYTEEKIVGGNVRATYKYKFPHHLLSKGSRLILYGAGSVGRDYYNQVIDSDDYDEIIWVDKNAQVYQKQGLKVEDIGKIQNAEYDYILVAVNSESVASEIKDELVEENINKEKIVWERPQKF